MPFWLPVIVGVPKASGHHVAAESDEAVWGDRCGDTVVIEKSGARRLGKRKFTFPEII